MNKFLFPLIFLFTSAVCDIIKNEKSSVVAILATDLDSINSPECGLLMSRIEENTFDIPISEDNEGIEPITHVQIPYNHRLNLSLFYFDKNGKMLGVYSKPGFEIILKDIKNYK